MNVNKHLLLNLSQEDIIEYDTQKYIRPQTLHLTLIINVHSILSAISLSQGCNGAVCFCDDRDACNGGRGVLVMGNRSDTWIGIIMWYYGCFQALAGLGITGYGLTHVI